MTVSLSCLGWDADFSIAYAWHHRADRLPARVVRVDLGVCTVLSERGPLRATISGPLLARAAADPVSLPCVGDWVAVQQWPDGRLTMEAVLPRRTMIGPAATGRAVAANVDIVAVFGSDRGGRLLRLARRSGARPIVLKAEAARAAGVEVVAPAQLCSPSSSFLVYGATLALLGPAGSSKTALIDRLAGATVMRTTTPWSLTLLPGGAVVIDAPDIPSAAAFGAAG